MLSLLLGEKEFILGNEVHLVDCKVFALVSVFINVSPFNDELASEFDSWLTVEATNLIEYHKRIKEKYWPDWTNPIH